MALIYELCWKIQEGARFKETCKEKNKEQVSKREKERESSGQNIRKENICRKQHCLDQNKGMERFLFLKYWDFWGLNWI